MRKNTQKYTISCVQCKKKFDAARPDAKTCGQNCRKKLSDRRKKMVDQYNNMIRYLNQLERSVSHPELGVDAYNLIARIQKKVCKSVIAADESETGKRLALAS